MSGNINLVSLPEEVIRYISNFLQLRDLLALSTTCQLLRSALNCNSVWRKYSQGGAVSQALSGVTSIVEPTFSNPQDVNSALEPICEHKLHFLRQSCLFKNYSEGKFVQQSVPFEFFLSGFETCHLFNDRQITYKDQYLFALGYCHGELFEEVKVYSIKEAPCMLMTFKLTKHGNDQYNVVMWLKVFENKLIVRQDEWFDVYEIKLPDLEFPLLHSIDVRISPSIDDNSLFLVRDLIFVENHSYSSRSNTVHMWNVSSGTRLGDINSKIEGSDFKICNTPGDTQDILFSVEVSNKGGSFITPHLFVYSVNALQYTDFYAILPFKSVSTIPLNYFGLMDTQYVVLIYDRQGWSVDIFVYDVQLSALLVQKSVELVNKTDSFIVNGYLALRKKTALEIVNLMNLETIWKIEFGAPIEAFFCNVHFINMMNFCNLILVKTSSCLEVWNVENRKKYFDLSSRIRFIDVSDSYSKLIVLKDATLETLTFW